MQTERDTHTERDTLLQEETHTPEGKTHTHTHSEGRNVYNECEAHTHTLRETHKHTE